MINLPCVRQTWLGRAVCLVQPAVGLAWTVFGRAIAMRGLASACFVPCVSQTIKDTVVVNQEDREGKQHGNERWKAGAFF